MSAHPSRSVPDRSDSSDPLDAYETTGSSPTGVHVVGLGPVGLALLDLLETHAVPVVAVSDTSGTARGEQADLRATVVRRAKEAHGSVAVDLGGRPGRLGLAIRDTGAAVVVDATATSFTRPEWTGLLESAVLDRGARLVLAAKDGACRGLPTWVRRFPGAVGINAVLGGTGARFLDELEDLAADEGRVRLAGNATTTTIIEVIEAGGSVDDGVDEAGRRGLLEADPELDLRGADAAVKLAVVVGTLTGRPVDPETIPTDHVRSLVPEEVRERAAHGQTTRLVGTWNGDGELAVRYESVALDDPLAVPGNRVAYVYECGPGDPRVHTGGGIGPVATAEAALADVRSFLGGAT